MGVIVQFGGQTPLNLARGLEAAGAPILGTSPDAIDRAEDRKRFQEIVDRLELRQPDNDTAMDAEEAIRVGRADRLSRPGPALLRPGRPVHGDRLRHGEPPALHGPGGRGLPGPPDPDRQVPRGRHRGGRGRHQRREDDRRRRDHGAHRGGGHPLRRQRLRRCRRSPFPPELLATDRSARRS